MLITSRFVVSRRRRRRRMIGRWIGFDGDCRGDDWVCGSVWVVVEIEKICDGCGESVLVAD